MGFFSARWVLKTWVMSDIPNEWKATATFSPCERFRYDLTRDWGLVGIQQGAGHDLFNQQDHGNAWVVFIGLNPSTATLRTNDPTVERCCRYAQRWGYRRMVMLNLFGYRATDPRNMKAFEEPAEGDAVGSGNDKAIRKWIKKAGMVVCCWGNHGEHLERSSKVLPMVPEPYALKVTKSGEPGHPLYLRGDLEPVRMDK